MSPARAIVEGLIAGHYSDREAYQHVYCAHGLRERAMVLGAYVALGYRTPPDLEGNRSCLHIGHALPWWPPYEHRAIRAAWRVHRAVSRRIAHLRTRSD